MEPETQQDDRDHPEIEKRGTPASSGIAIGRAYILDRRRLSIPKTQIDDDDVDEEIARLARALKTSDRQLSRIKEKIQAREESEHYNIIAAHQLILHDEHLVDEAIRRIREDHINAEWALRQTVEHIKGVFDAIEEEYFRERRSDVEFVGERVLRNLLGRDAPVKPPPDAIVVAHDLSPADTAQLFRAAVAGLATDAGGKTSHTAITARAHEIPSVVGLEDLSSVVGNGDLLVVDGAAGVVIINPTPDTVAIYRERARAEAARGAALLENRDLPAVTTDGVHVEIFANVDHADEIASARSHGAVGIGLYRTEYMFMVGTDIPTEEEHYEHARDVLARLDGHPATFRTFDLGADKISRLLPDHHPEQNPALGLRSMRLALSEPIRPLLKEQVRGLLRASAHGPLRIMFPMISGVGELGEARALLDEAAAELASEGIPYDTGIHVGVMVEMPSAAVIADVLAPKVDFFSIGTNDLIQYTLAVDRGNEYVAYAYEPLHPALIRLIAHVTEAAATAGIPVGVCGEAAGDPLIAPVLLGLGVRELSMNAVAIPEVKSHVRAAKMADLTALGERVKTLTTTADIREAVKETLARL
ncbi:MAG TPA: phosphoenolpyruvate--protein phosphotransferase, partial [Kofleriaceae bacterium]|nr:phosphoenolpyruvate--protein phosphotransferase [Kofleriaceae bacterium]